MPTKGRFGFVTNWRDKDSKDNDSKETEVIYDSTDDNEGGKQDADDSE